MPGKSQQTKNKISAGVKAAHARRKDNANPTRARINSLEAGFALGHPDGHKPARTRNYGGLGRDVTKVMPTSREARERTQREDVLARQEQSVIEAEHRGVSTPAQLRLQAEGTHGGQVSPPKTAKVSKAQTKRTELMQKRLEAVNGT